MPTLEEEKRHLSAIGLGRLLDVMDTSDGFVETDPEGQQRRYSAPDRDKIQIMNLNVFRSVDVASGDAHYYLRGITKTRYRPLGAEKAYVLDVVLNPRYAPNRATISMSLQGHSHGFYNSFGFRLQVGLSAPVIEHVISEARAATTPRDLVISLVKPAFFAGEGAIGEPEELLPYWGKQRPEKRPMDFNRGDQIDLEWSFDVQEIVVQPTNPHSRFSSEFDKHEDRIRSVQAKGDISIHSSPEREAAVKLAYVQVLTTLNGIVGTLNGIRSGLAILTIAAAAIAVRLWFQ